MSNYAIMRLEKRKLGSVTRICNHHERLKDQYKSNPDIDSSRTKYNYHIVEPEEKYRPAVLRRIEEAGAKMRKDSVVLQDCLVTASPEWINDQTYETQVEFFNHAYDFFNKEFGKENIVSAVVHMDEANPHMHLCFVPITKDNRLSSKDIIGGPKGLVKHQDNFYEHMQEKFPTLSRGIPRSITKRKHIPTHMYKNADMLMSHYQEIVDAVRDIGLVGNAKKKEEAIALLGKYAPEMAKMKSQLKMTDSHISNLEIGLKNMESIASSKDSKIADQEMEIYKLRSQLLQLNQKQKQLQKTISKIPPELLEQMNKDEKLRRKNKEAR